MMLRDGDPLSGDALVAFELARPTRTLPGDYNGTERVEQGDLDLVLLHWGQEGSIPPMGWTGSGPLGIIDQDELDGVLLHWGEGQAGAALPEPHGWTALLMAVTILAAAGIRRFRSLAIGLDSRG